ncbi:YceI family protein [Alicyclobacillus tolerans]|uniref:Polyisoprenoid-binding protein YceI n=2 Tax=Alicyclobacillus tolerans TaxID=90970 RepID=A0ABT9LW02_9BACL|nr:MULTISPECIES: YceI family protein [Alicyclobacillus]MDP9728413.1 polyisoprenoid-binding protein YceI [Alicyclobacillus tengchongensis]SHK15760.1 Polyisoprenoid-binding protein YceI [Alicyclobacillus montanus]
MAKTVWELDKAHSYVGFSVRHMMVSNVRGVFNDFDATVHTEGEDLSTADIVVTINPNSIDTRNSQRDEHLRSADFFKVNEYPEIVFRAHNLQHKGGEKHELQGEITIVGVTKPLTLDVEISGPAKNPWGNEVIGVVGSGSLNRSDFGLTYNAALETGGVLIGDTIKLNIEVEFVKKSE